MSSHVHCDHLHPIIPQLINYFDLFLPEGDLGVAFVGCGLALVCVGTGTECTD